MNLLNKYRKGVLSGIAAIITIVTGVLTVPGLIPLAWFPVVAGVVAALGTVAVVLSPKNATVEELAIATLDAAVAAAPKVGPHLDVAALAAVLDHLNANPALAQAVVEAPPTPPTTP